MKLKDFKNVRIILLLFFLLIAYLAINPQFDNSDGVAIRSVAKNSTADLNGMRTPDLGKISLTDLEIIKKVNGDSITTIDEYNLAVNSVLPDSIITIETNQQTYAFLKESNQSLGISVTKAPTSNLRRGLDLQGGTRVLLRPETPITDQERADLIDIMDNRLNTYGLSDITIREANDLIGGETFILVEIAGATRTEVQRLIESQGKFQAKIGDDVVFQGSEKDVVFVCKNDGTCSGVRSCQPHSEGTHSCTFEFQIGLSEAAAKRQATLTKDLEVNQTEGGQYLSENLDMYLDDILVSSLRISTSLRGRASDQITISGPGFGIDQASALDDAISEMQHLQTVLLTGSLPVKLETVKIDNISPTLGASFVRNALLAGGLALLAVAIVLLLRYRSLKIVIPSLIIMLSETFLILGAAALLRFSLDLAAIAGIIAAVGTGVDDQIVIIDEVRKGGTALSKSDWKRRVKRAFFIVLVAYATTVAAMIPLFVAGAGLLTGFAFSTIVGVTLGVFVTRPAFASLIEIWLRPKL